jgi:putative oxidoreductase
MFPEPAWFTDLALLLLRVMVGVVFATSGWSHVRRSEERSKSIEMSRGFTMFLGVAEFLGIIAGVFTLLAAIGLILVILGAIWKKIFRWHTEFWGERRPTAGTTT